jgi:hypothetical protein
MIMETATRIASIIEVMERLTTLLDREVASLHRLRVRELAELQEAKLALADSYEAAASWLAAHRDELQEIAPELRAQLDATAAALDRAAARNDLALRIAKDAPRRRVSSPRPAPCSTPSCRSRRRDTRNPQLFGNNSRRNCFRLRRHSGGALRMLIEPVMNTTVPPFAILDSSDADAERQRLVLDTRFGGVTFDRTQALHLPRGLLGFPQTHDYGLARLPGDEVGAYLLLQGLEEPTLSFIGLPIDMAKGPIGRSDIEEALTARHRVAGCGGDLHRHVAPRGRWPGRYCQHAGAGLHRHTAAACLAARAQQPAVPDSPSDLKPKAEARTKGPSAASILASPRLTPPHAAPTTPAHQRRHMAR